MVRQVRVVRHVRVAPVVAGGELPGALGADGARLALLLLAPAAARAAAHAHAHAPLQERLQNVPSLTTLQ